MKQSMLRPLRANALFALFAVQLAFSLSSDVRAEISPKYYAVEASVTVQESPARITISWPADPRATGYTIHRKAPNGGTWAPKANLPGNALSFSDSDVVLGTAYEYQISKSTSLGYKGYAYVLAGVRTPFAEQRGKVILIVDNTYASELASELARLEQDLIGDGWTVRRHDVSRQEPPTKIKSIIKSEYDADPANVRSVFLFGHVAVPYSGNFAPDGHEPDHRGAWPADAYYGDMDGNWTDSSVNTRAAERSRNWNVPGDGKFDQTELPSDIELEVGRVDLHNMTCFANKSFSRSEKDLLRQYLNKDHNFRQGRVQVARRGLICDNFGERDGEAFAGSGWRNFSVFFGANNVSEVPGWNYFPTVSSQSYLWSYGTGGGSFYTCNGIGSSDDFATNDIKTVFTMFLGSYFGDWDNESNFLRAPLGSTSYTLTSSWAGRPHWFYHHMALGETIGYSTKLSQNNRSGGPYAVQQNNYTRQSHVALMGDPTLRMHPVLPPTGVTASSSGNGVTVSWSPSGDTDIQGYHVYRSDSPRGPFQRVTRSGLITGTSFSDSSGSAGHTYMVRAVKLERSASGSYLNPSQGTFSIPSSGGSQPPAPPQVSAPAAPAGLSAVANPNALRVGLNWIDNSSDETGFRIERKTEASGAYQQIAQVGANAVDFIDSNVSSGVVYVYRVTAINSAGSSPASNEAAVRVDSAPAVPAKATFVRTDTEVRGDWKGKFGSDGFHIMGDSVKYPAYAVVTSNGNNKFEWGDSSTDSRALVRDNGSGRVPACWFSDSSFTVEINLIDGQSHQLALYCVDWDTTQRSQTVEIVDAASGNILDKRNLSSFNSGSYLIWNVQGRVQVRLSRVAGNNALMMGLFFDPSIGTPGGSSGQPPTIAPVLAQGKFQLRIQGNVGQRFVIQASSDLTDWTAISSVTLTSIEQIFVDPQASSFPARYYRAVPEP